MNKKVAIIAGLAIVGVIGAFALVGNKDTKTNDKELITITDGKGEVEVIKNPKTVVTFDYGALDALDNMGIEVKGLPKASVPSSLSKYEDEKYVNLGDLKEPDFEAVSELKPDLIVISGRQEDMYDKFKEIAPTVYLGVDGSNYMDDFKRNMTALGEIFDKEDFINKKIENIENRIEEINKKVKGKNININASTVMANDGNLSAFAAKSRFGLIYNQLGFNNIDTTLEESNHGQQVSFEYLLDKNPEYIFVIDRGSAIGGESSAKALFDNEIIKATNAYKNDKIVYLNSEAWYIIAGGITSTETMLNDIENSL